MSDSKQGQAVPSSHGEQAPVTQGYAPPNSQGYGPPGSQGYGPPGSQGYGPPGSNAGPPQGYYYDAQGQLVQGQYGYHPQQQPTSGGYIPPQPGVPGAPPGPAAMMVRPAPIPGVPPGLEYLAQVDQLLVHQVIEVFEMMTSWETKNRYMVKNSVGQQVYFAQEESDGCQRQCCGPQRGFIMHITDNLGQEVIRVTRDFKCCAGANCCASCDSCAMEIKVESPPGQVIGGVKQECSCLSPTYGVLDGEGRKVLGIHGPMCFCQAICCPNDIDFKVASEGGDEIGKISKQWGGFAREAFTQADNFGVNFPRDLDVRMEAVLLGAVFLIDFMYFEQKQNNK